MTKTPKVIFRCNFKFAMDHPDRPFTYTEVSARNMIGGMYNYFSNVKKRAMNMFDYFEGKINKVETANLVLENGKYATVEEIAKRKKDYIKYFKKSNLWQGIISFDNDYINESIELEELEKKIVKEVLPRFFKKCGFKDIKKMSYQVALHTNTDNYHFHISFIEKEPNYVCDNGTIKYRRKGVFSKEEKDFLKNEILHVIDRHREFSPLVVSVNNDIEELKKYFKSNTRNFVLKNYDDLVLEENILRLGKLIYNKRDGKDTKIKFNSIYDKEIKDLTKSIKKYLFKDKRSELYQCEEKFQNSLNDINDYFYKLNKENNIKSKYKSEYSTKKKEYIDNYIYNAIVNHASYKFARLKKNKDYLTDEEIINEAVLKMYKKNKKQGKTEILINYLKNNTEQNKYKNRYRIEQSLKNINSEMEEAKLEFSKLFQNDVNKNTSYE